MIVQDLLRNFSWIPVRRELSRGPHASIRSPAVTTEPVTVPSINRRSTERVLISHRKEGLKHCFFYVYMLRSLRFFGIAVFPIPSLLHVHLVSPRSQKVYKYRNALWDSFERFARGTPSSYLFKNITSLKLPLHFQTSTTARFGKWATTNVGTLFRLIPFLEKRRGNDRLLRLARLACLRL